MAVITAALLAVVANMSLGEAKPPPGAKNMSAADLANLLDRSEMTPAIAAGVANAKRRAYETQQKSGKGKKLRTAGSGSDSDSGSAGSGSTGGSSDSASQGFKTIGGGDTSPAENKTIAKELNAAKGWSNCWDSLLALWNRESTWNERAENVSSGAYGIPQALPGTKMATIASDWRTNARTQITWGLGYIDARYGTPCEAWGHSEANGWY